MSSRAKAKGRPVVKPRIFGVCLLLASLSACAAEFRNHGYAPTDAELAEVLVGIDTRGSVEETLG
ncbi:MAG: outer membrane protein assembly factor BamE, partial [Pseudomonadota bacterium]